MRLGIDGLPTRIPLVGLLPSVLQEDPMTVTWMAALDEVLAPVLTTLDSVDAYLDPMTAPEDFLLWLGGWVGLDVPEEVSVSVRRELTGSLAFLQSTRGTVAALAHALQLEAPARVVDINDGGGATWTSNPREGLDAGDPVRLVVTVQGTEEEVERTRNIVARWCPAHVPFSVVVEEGEDATS